MSLLAACSEGSDTHTSAATAAPASQGGEACELPAEYRHFPVVEGCFHVNDLGIALSLSTTLSQDEALVFFEREMPAAGWVLEGRQTMDDDIVHLDYSGHDVRSAWVEVGARDSADDRTIGVTYYVN
ncbi:MAG: hypothetical protein ACNS61_04470 [Candidatus Wenzhouxiangella sp. M2_3B_020]